MTPALNAAVGGIGAASKRFGAAATTIVAVSAYQAAGAASVTRAVQPTGGAQAGDFGGGGLENQGGRLPLPDGLLALLQEAGGSGSRARFGELPTLEEATVDSILSQRAFEANLRSFQAADRMLGATLDLVA